MTDNTSFGDRMKAYEHVSKHKLTRRMPVIIRIDGRAFHTFTRKFNKPYDDNLIRMMTSTTLGLLEGIQGCVFAYTQSDEISLLLCDWYSFETEPWYGNCQNKLESVSASFATALFNQRLEVYRKQHPEDTPDFAMFDSRAFNLPKEEVVNYFLWRQRDAIRNSIQGYGQAILGQKKIHGLNTTQVIEALREQAAFSWENIPTHMKNGIAAYYVKAALMKSSITQRGLPSFSEDRELITNIMEDGHLS